jgi:chemotaxis protein methyltransferase CheR
MAGKAGSVPGCDEVIRLLGERTGLSFRPGRREAVEQAVRQAMRRTGIADGNRFARFLADDAATLDELISELTVGETYFFREPGQFQFLRDTILPAIRDNRSRHHILRAWSAGCASGEEPYSLAILFDREGQAKQTNILATDISRKALERAHEGTYYTWSLRGAGAALARPYLTFDGQCYRLDAHIRSRVRFEYLNLAVDVYPSIVTGTWDVDLIFCRNVLIYLDRDTIRSVAGRLFESLAVGGWLITSSADPPVDQWAPFETVSTDWGVFYCRPPPVTLRPSVALPEPAQEIGDLAAIPATPLAADTERAIPVDIPEGEIKEDTLDAARQALGDGEYERAAELAGAPPPNPAACAIRVEALANLDPAAAQAACAEALVRYPLSTELHYLHAVLLLEADRHEEAAQAARRVVFLDRSLAIGHFLLGSILRHAGDLNGARRAFRNVRDLCASRPADEPVPLTDGETAGRLAEAAEVQLTGLEIPTG